MDEALFKKLQDKDFAAKILEFGSKEEVKNFLKNEGYEISNEELDHMAETLKGVADNTKNLGDEELEAISGGDGGLSSALVPYIGQPTGGSGIGGMAIGIGTAGLASVGAVGVYLYNRFKKPEPEPKPKGMSTSKKVAIGAGSAAAVVGVAALGVLGFKKLRKCGWLS